MPNIKAWFLSRLFERVSFQKLRAGYFQKGKLSTAFSFVDSKQLPLKNSERIVVVGTGIAAFTFLKQLRESGFKNVTIIAKDQNYGGTCVNFGCMPTEYLYSLLDRGHAVDTREIEAFTFALRAMVESQFMAMGYTTISGEMDRIDGKNLRLKNGKSLEFDRLILALGSGHQIPHRLRPTLTLETFWKLESGRLVICSDGSPAALTLADIAQSRGVDVTVVQLRQSALDRLPSYQAFQSEIERNGVRILQARKVHQEGETLKVLCRNGMSEIDCKNLMWAGAGAPKEIQMDSKTVTGFQTDMLSGVLPERADIAIVGDAVGLMGASEAELQAVKLFEYWTSGSRLKSEEITRLPLRLHAKKTLAMVGAPQSLLAGGWHEIDFRELGWTLISKYEGRLWYQFNKSTNKIVAIHILHPLAGELISLASALIELPITDSRWMTSSVHPSSAEIFKILALRLRAANRSRVVDLAMETIRIALPPIESILTGEPPVWLSEANKRTALLSSRPELYFAILYGLHSMPTSMDKISGILLREDPNDGFVFDGSEDFKIKVVQPSPLIVDVQYGRASSQVYCDRQGDLPLV